MATKRIQIRQMTLMAMLTALCVVLRIVKIIPVPNVQPVTDILMIVILVMGSSFGLGLTLMTMLLSNMVLGLGIWTIPQILAYTVCILTVAWLAKIIPIRKHLIWQLILATFLGFEYGFFVSIGMSIYGGIAAFFAYWISGLVFDSFHAIGNFGFYLILYKPLAVALKRYVNHS